MTARPLARLYLATRSPVDGAPVFLDVPAEWRTADAVADMDDATWAADPPAESGWRWTLALIAAGCAVVFVVVPLVRAWW